jgi:hypothetical protein
VNYQGMKEYDDSIRRMDFMIVEHGLFILSRLNGTGAARNNITENAWNFEGKKDDYLIDLKWITNIEQIKLI